MLPYRALSARGKGGARPLPGLRPSLYQLDPSGLPAGRGASLPKVAISQPKVVRLKSWDVGRFSPTLKAEKSRPHPTQQEEELTAPEEATCSCPCSPASWAGSSAASRCSSGIPGRPARAAGRDPD